jgi:hypothetical protein
VSYNFKSDLTFHTTNNKNRKMSLSVYCDQTLKLIVKPWLKREDDFVLEEDNNSGHSGGTSKRGDIVQSWKKEHNLKHYFNFSCFPDLAPIENCWQLPKQFMARFPHWDEFETRGMALNG